MIARPPAPPRKTGLALTMTSLSLSSGLRVVVVQDPHATEVAVTMRYQVGGVDDPPEHPGMAHLVEHLMFQQVLGAESLFARLERVTTEFNAFTTYDATTYLSRAATSHLDELLSTEAVRVGFRCQTITDAAFEREREVVANEIAQHGESEEIIADLQAGAYPPNHPYAHPLGGSVDAVRAITREQACAFADAHYAPGNAVLVVSGNLTVAQVEGSLKKFLGRVAGRAATPPVLVRAVPEGGRTGEIQLPIDDEAVLIAWPLPDEPAIRIRVAAVAPYVATAIDGAVKGRVVRIALGDTRAPMSGVVVFPAKGESVDDVLKAADRAIAGVASELEYTGIIEYGQLVFDRLQQSAIYRLFSSFEPSIGTDTRDGRIAAYVLAGDDADAALSAEFTGLREMTRTTAISIVRDELAFDSATVIRLHPDGKKRGRPAELEVSIHDLGRRRDLPDPAAAHQPAPAVELPAVDAIRTRRLPNGLKVVLLPLTSVPLVDARLVFDAGTGDEPADRRGVAVAAGRGLTWDYHYLNDLLLFAGAGGSGRVDVTRDDTAFIAEGLDMHLDLLLAGLRRWVREGHYTASSIGDALRQEAKSIEDDGPLTDAWRGALYGRNHPYAGAGLPRHAGSGLSIDEAAEFRAQHYAPDNATLVIAGRFDAALADQWIDYLFADWTGHAVPRASPAATLEPVSIAAAEDTSRVGVSIVLPVDPARRAANLVAAEMLADIADDVRHQLGATYGLRTGLDASRLASHLYVSGSIDAPRTRDAVQLLRDRLANLRGDADAAARAFVVARARVLTHAVSIAGSAGALADRTEYDRGPLLQVATDVQKLRIDDMTATLAELDLARAAVVMRGPKAEIDRAYDALGRTPTYVAAKHVEPPVVEAVHAPDHDPDLHLSDIEEAITQHEPPHNAFAVTSGFAIGTMNSGGVTGAAVAAEVGRTLHHSTIGFRASMAYLSGTFDTGGQYLEIPHPISAIPISLAVVLRTSTANRLWGGIFAGIDVTHVSTPDMPAMAGWTAAFGIGLEAGFDAWVHDGHRVGLYAAFNTEFPDGALLAFTLGLAYRR